MQLSWTLTSLFYCFMQSVIVTFYQVKKRISNQLTNLFLLEKWKTVTALLIEINLESFKIDLFHICDLMNYGFAEATWAIYLDLRFFLINEENYYYFLLFSKLVFMSQTFLPSTETLPRPVALVYPAVGFLKFSLPLTPNFLLSQHF